MWHTAAVVRIGVGRQAAWAARSLGFLIEPCVDGAYHPFLDHLNEQELSPNNRHVSIPAVAQ